MKLLLGPIKQKTKNSLLSLVPKNSVVCEIGVWEGDFSERILKELKPKELHLVDPWKYYSQYKKRWYGGARAKSQKDMDKIFKAVKKKFAGGKNVRIYRMTSDEAAGRLQDDYFDFIYIDGDHTYEFVKKDLENYYPKLKEGGLMAGDDYFWREGASFSVRKAVKEFSAENKTDYRLFFDNFLIRKT